MCILFRCQSCEVHLLESQAKTQATSNINGDESDSSSNSVTYVNYCSDVALNDRDKGVPCPKQSWHTGPQPNCFACTNVCGAIERLDRLVFMYPWLKAEGLSALDGMAKWEKDNLGGLNKKVGHWDGEDEDIEEEEKVQKKLVKMGLSSLEDHRVQHQGFGAEVLMKKEESKKRKIEILKTGECEGW